MTLYPKDALVSAVHNASKPLAFLVGSPLSAGPDGSGVPSVDRMLEFVGREVDAHAAVSKAGYEAALAGKTGADAYQASLRWLQGYVGQDAVNSVIQKAVLQACISPADLQEDGRIVRDGSPADWRIPQGALSLASLLCTGGPGFPGPVITTNFDPLISLSCRVAGLRPNRRVLDADGALPREVEEEPDSRTVVHLHGYWRGSDTLHTPDQLRAVRPKLKASLQRLLRNRVLLVVAYGGWDDIFMQALADLLNDDDAELEVIWCFHEVDEDLVSARYSHLLQVVMPAIARGRFRLYGGIDCHTIFSEIATTTGPVAVASSRPDTSPLDGWDLVDSAYLTSLAPLKREEVLLYFDGAVPTWRHARSDWIPRRCAVADLGNALMNAGNACSECSMHVILSAGGEGKSTILLQTAADAALSNDWRVLWRPRPGVSLCPAQVVALDPMQRWLVVADDAENLINEILTAAEQLHASGNTNVHFLLAARDTDWRAARGYARPWSSHVFAAPYVKLRGLSESDAENIVGAWATQGEEGLGELGRFPEADRVGGFRELVRREADAGGEGSFFGGLLAARFTDERLRAHIRNLLMHLRDIGIEGSSRSLSDALLYIAACHSVGIPGVDEKVLADLLGVPRERVYSRVVRPLGDEAAAVYSAGCVQTRHGKVARAVVAESDEAHGEDLVETWRSLVRQTVLTSRDTYVARQCHGSVIHAGPKLQRSLHHSIPEARRADIAIAAAQTAIELDPDRLSRLVDLGKTLRNAGMLTEAVEVFRGSALSLGSKVDYITDVRGYYYEWGVCEGQLRDSSSRRSADVWLQGISLSDHLNPAPIRAKQAKLSCAGLGLAFGKLSQPESTHCFALARRAAAYIGRLTDFDAKAASYYDIHDREVDEAGVPYPHSTAQAIEWLQDGVRMAWRDSADELLQDLADPAQMTFGSLLKLVD